MSSSQVMNTHTYEITQEEILSLTLNQDQGNFIAHPESNSLFLECFACGTNYGFKIYKTYPFKQTLIRGFPFQYISL